MNPHYPLVALRAGHRCEYCHAPESVFNFPFEVEHVMPLSQDGRNDDSNLALSCRSCNLYKGPAIDGLDEESGNIAPLFHPRQHEWETHFEVDMETGKLVGLTDVARVTINRLRLNSDLQLRARKVWLRLELFP